MSFRRDQRGFIFSLDASLALIIVLTIMIGVSRVGGNNATYEQQGYLRLERYANDALETMQLTGALDNIINFVKQDNIDNAKNLARTQLDKILPHNIQFKFIIGNNRLTVYPSTATGWNSEFENANELATATRMSTLPPKENFRVLAWLDDDADRAFMDEIARYTGWQVTETSDETFFQNEILRWDTAVWPNQRYYKTVFIPDAQRDFNGITESNLVTFALHIGRLVVGGDTLWYNRQSNGTLSTPLLYEVLGVDYQYIGRPPLDSRNTGLHVIDDNNPITTSPYFICYRADYAGSSYYMYVYRPQISVGSVTTVLAQWDNVPTAGGVDTPPWRGIIFRDQYVAGELGRKGTGVLFNMRLAQSAISGEEGTEDWITFARRAIYWDGNPWEFEPVTLYVWRGESVS